MPTSYGGFDPSALQKNPEDEQRKLGGYIGLGFIVVAVLALFIVWRNSHRPVHHGPMPAPVIAAITTYQVLRSPNNIYKIDVPTNWNYTNRSDPGADENVEGFQNSAAVVAVIDDGAASTQTIPNSGGDDDSSPPGPVTNATPDSSPLANQHEMAQMTCEELVGPINDGTPSLITTGLGPAYISQFTVEPNRRQKIMWKMRGYRETILTPIRRVMVICVCPDADWNTLQPGFWHIMNSAGTD